MKMNSRVLIALILMQLRHAWCQEVKVDDVGMSHSGESECAAWLEAATNFTNQLSPKMVSLVIVSHNENASVLSNTLDSLLNNTLQDLLKEVIVVDDFSNPSIVVDDKYSVTVIRNDERQGLVRSRIIGASKAMGHIIVFSDSHIQFSRNWLTGIVYHLLSSASRHLVSSPFMNAFIENGTTFQAVDYLRGGFEWDMSFIWEPMTEIEKEKLNSIGKSLNQTWRSLPRPTPTIAGSVFGMRRDDFFSLGALDPGMKIWGGENIELSLRAWMCGGRVEIVPCSQVAHLFRTDHNYIFPEGRAATITRNLKRVVKVWMENSGDIMVGSNWTHPIALFYSAHPDALRIPVLNINRRLQLKQDLGCKDFAWFLENVYPELKTKAQHVELKDNAIFTARRAEVRRKLK